MSVRKQATLVFCVLFFCYAYVHQGRGWNQDSRLDLLHALFVHKTFQIDAYHKNTGDKSVYDGHYYSDKAPGIVFLAFPAFVASATILNWFHIPIDSLEGWAKSSWITTVGSVGLVTSLGGVAMFVFLSRFVGQRFAFLTTLSVFLGAAPFPYATMLFSHAAVSALICIALWAIMDETFWECLTIQTSAAVTYNFSPVGSPRHAPLPEMKGWQFGMLSERWLKCHLLAGLCCGLAIASEYTAATAAGGVLLLAFVTRFKRGLALALGAVPPLLLIPAYNWACFGGPLAFGYHHLALPEFQEMNKGLFGITFPPKVGAAYLILVSPERGLFFWTPFFVVIFLGIKSFLKTSRTLFWVSFVVVLVHVLCISGYYMPGGGNALGPRHLAPMLPFLTLMAVFGFRAAWPVSAVYGFASIVLTGGATLITAMPWNFDTVEMYLHRMLELRFTQTFGTAIGLPQWLSIAVISIAISAVYALGCFQRDEPGKVEEESH